MALALSSTPATRFLPTRLPKVCLALSGETAEDMVATAESMARDNPFLEFRLDYLKQPLAALPKIHRFLETHQYVTAIGTCRRADNGGKFKGSLATQLEVLTRAHAAGLQIVDLELQSASKAKPEAIARLRSRAALILSFHDFRATRNLDETLGKMLKIPADFYKVVTTATTLSDNVAMMKFLQAQSSKHALIGLCMGEQGIISRVLSVRAGSAFTFAAVSADLKTAPGQVSARDLRSIYRIDQVDAATRIYGVAGDPIEHSLSPVIMNAALRRENVNGVYLPLHAKTLKELIHCVREIPLHGLSITMPYKQAMLPYLDNSPGVPSGDDAPVGLLRPARLPAPLSGTRTRGWRRGRRWWPWRRMPATPSIPSAGATAASMRTRRAIPWRYGGAPVPRRSRPGGCCVAEYRSRFRRHFPPAQAPLPRPLPARRDRWRGRNFLRKTDRR